MVGRPAAVRLSRRVGAPADRARGWDACPRTRPPRHRARPRPRAWCGSPEGASAWGRRPSIPRSGRCMTSTVEGFWMDELPVTVGGVPPFREGHGPRDDGGGATGPRRLPGRRSGPHGPRLGGVPDATRTGLARRRDAAGGTGCPARTGGTRRDRAARSTGATGTRSPMSATTTRSPTRRWAGKALPTETEWERAARGGLDGAVFAWGDEFAPKGRDDGQHLAGPVPMGEPLRRRVRRHLAREELSAQRLRAVRHHGERVGVDRVAVRAALQRSTAPVPAAVRPGPPWTGEPLPRLVIKGGSHLCAPNYCLRYRPAARQAETPDTSTSHIGLRCIVRA